MWALGGRGLFGRRRARVPRDYGGPLAAVVATEAISSLRVLISTES